MTKILVIDNYDSFVYTLNGYLQELGAETVVVRNDQIPLEELDATLAEYDGVLVSPGPGKPSDAGVSIAAVHSARKQSIPLLGVCLGHQAIGEAFGATVSRAPELLHGKTSIVHHNGKGVMTNLPSPFTATRYHSLAVEADTVPDVLEVTSKTDSGVIMSLRHKSLPIEGVQFHPESVLTEHGHKMLANFLAQCGDASALAKAEGLSPVINR